MSNHVFPRPCPNPSNDEVKGWATDLMRRAEYFDAHQIVRNGLTVLCDAFHGDAVAAGWHHDIRTSQPRHRNMSEMLMLAVSELAEAMEGHRKNLMDDKLPHRAMAEVELADFVIRCCDTIRVLPAQERGFPLRHRPMPLHMAQGGAVNFGRRLLMLTRAMTDADVAHENGDVPLVESCLVQGIVWACDLAREFGLDLPGALVEKRDVNRTREDHSVAARLAENGKAY